MSNYCQGCKDRQDEIADLEQTIRRLHNEHIDITHDVAARYIVEIDVMKAENQRLKGLFRIACEVLARDDIELDADGHRHMIERCYEDMKERAQ